MATITITVPDGTPARIVDALCAEFAYEQTKLDGETRAQFAQRQTRLWWRDAVLGQDGRRAVEAIRNNLDDPLVTDSLTAVAVATEKP